MKNFAGIKNSRIFAMSLTTRGMRTRNILTGIFYTLLIYGFVTPCGRLMAPLPRVGEGQWEVRNHSLFSAQSINSFNMSELHEKNLQGVNNSNPSAKPEPESLKKLIRELEKRVSELQRGNDYMRFYIARNHPSGFSLFEKEHPIDSQDWGKLCEIENKLKNLNL